MALTQKEIIEFEESNRDVIRLYLEGTFLKAYERSAFAFCTRVKDFKVLRKESKTLGRDILYVGFPAAAVDTTLSGCMTRHIDEKITRSNMRRIKRNYLNVLCLETNHFTLQFVENSYKGYMSHFNVSSFSPIAFRV